MNKYIEKREGSDLTQGNFPEELKPFEMGVGPAVSVGKAAGNIISDMIDGIVDFFCDDEKERDSHSAS